MRCLQVGHRLDSLMPWHTHVLAVEQDGKGGEAAWRWQTAAEFVARQAKAKMS